jgi:hypothetical protein
MKKILIFGVLLSVLAFSTVETGNNIAKVRQSSGMYIFVDSKPVNEYQIVGVVKARVGFNGVGYEDIKEKLVDKAKKMYPHAEGIIFRLGTSGSMNYGDVITYKK